MPAAVGEVAADLDYSAGLRVSAIVAKPNLGARSDGASPFHLEGPRRLEDEANARHVGLRRSEVPSFARARSHFVRVHPYPEGVRAYCDLQGLRLARIEKRPARPDVAHADAKVGFLLLGSLTLDGEVAASHSCDTPDVEPVGERAPRVGVDGSERALDLSRVVSFAHRVGTVSCARAQSQPREPTVARDI